MLLRLSLALGALLGALLGCAAQIADQAHGFVDVRPGAHMFWWLYGKTGGLREASPVVMWLQGGPGAGGSGFGNFGEFGPLDENLNPRNATWLSAANLLFVDNPVGAGYSYVDDLTLLPTTNAAIAADMVALLTAFTAAVPEAQTLPFFIFSESYGGKMTIQIADALTTAIEAGQLKMNLRGAVLGDSWISCVGVPPSVIAARRLESAEKSHENAS